MAKDRVFNTRKPRLLRKHISLRENIVVLVLLCGLIGVVFWVVIQRYNYNPKDRDIPVEQLLQSSNQQKLYNLPLKPWVEPGVDTTKPVKPDLGIFPEIIVDQEWQAGARLKRFGPENLFEKINGEAEKFLRQGFKSLYYIILRAKEEESELSIELYDQGDTTGSIGIFSDHVSGDKAIEQNGPVTFFKTSNGAIGRKGKYFFRIAGSQENEKIRKKSEQVAVAFSQLEESEEDPSEEFRILSRGLEISPNLITFQSENVFQFDFVKNFWFGQLNSENSTRAFVHRAASPEEAGKLFGEIVSEQGSDYEMVEQTDSRAVMLHNYLKNHFVMDYRGPFIFGIENLADKNQIGPIMERLAKEVDGG
jgi:hypothetical protein